MFFDLKKFANHIAVETEQGLKMTYAQLDMDASSIVSVMEPRKNRCNHDATKQLMQTMI